MPCARSAGGSWSDVEFLTQGPAADPVLTTDVEGNVIVAWSADDDIIVLRWEGSRWGSRELVGSGFSPTFASGEGLTIAWTRPTGSGYELVVTDLPAAGETSPVPVFIGAGALAVIFAALMLRRRSQSQPD